MMRFSHFQYHEKQWSPLNEMPFQVPTVQAHRGYWVNGEKQNTLGSLLAARQAGFKMAEVDIRITRDGEIVLFHDALVFDVDQAIKIRSHDFNDLKKFLEITTLSDVFEKLPSDFLLNLEIKNESKIDFSLEEKLIQVLKNSSHRNRILFSSFNPLSLAWMNRLMPEVPRALLVTQERESQNSFLLREMSFMRLVKPHMINIRWEDLDHYRDIPADRKAVWTLNSLSHAKSLFKRQKISSVITDTLLPNDFEETHELSQI